MKNNLNQQIFDLANKKGTNKGKIVPKKYDIV